jgi:hypothetical protein
MVSCINPFAPKEIDSLSVDAALGDQTTIDGVFQNFRYSYNFKDTVVYGKLLAEDFTFIFRNYERGVDVSWGREEDMISTYRFFNASQSLDLIWNDVIVSAGDSISRELSRGFTLTIVFNPADIVRVQGRANFQLFRDAADQPWLITTWRDESNY